MAINDPSNHVGQLLQWSGGGWGYVFVIAGLVIGGIVGANVFDVPPTASCISGYVDGVYDVCASVIQRPNPEGAANALLAGAVYGGMASLLVWLGVRSMRPPAA